MEGVNKKVIALSMTLLTGSVILSSLPSSQGSVSSAQSVNVSEGTLKLGHYVYYKGKGWLKQAARHKPMIDLYSRLDMNAYKALAIKPPDRQFRVSFGKYLADTGESICLGGKGYLRSLGLTEEDLTPCDMSVCSASNTNIHVIGALLVEFSRGTNKSDRTTKQIVYMCEGVRGVLLSFEACVDLVIEEDSIKCLEWIPFRLFGSFM